MLEMIRVAYIPLLDFDGPVRHVLEFATLLMRSSSLFMLILLHIYGKFVMAISYFYHGCMCASYWEYVDELRCGLCLICLLWIFASSFQTLLVIYCELIYNKLLVLSHL